MHALPHTADWPRCQHMCPSVGTAPCCWLLQMEVTFSSMAEWESFIAAIPLQEHKAWTQRIQGMVVDGSPVWQAHRSVPLTPADGVSNSAAWQTASSSSSSSSMMDGNAKQLVIADQASGGVQACCLTI